MKRYLFPLWVQSFFYGASGMLAWFAISNGGLFKNPFFMGYAIFVALGLVWSLISKYLEN